MVLRSGESWKGRHIGKNDHVNIQKCLSYPCLGKGFIFKTSVEGFYAQFGMPRVWNWLSCKSHIYKNYGFLFSFFLICIFWTPLKHEIHWAMTYSNCHSWIGLFCRGELSSYWLHPHTDCVPPWCWNVLLIIPTSCAAYSDNCRAPSLKIHWKKNGKKKVII